MFLMAGLAGLVAGAIANYFAERWSVSSRGVSPWLGATRAGGRVPVIGWWLRRGEVNAIAPGGWIRPLVVELGMAGIFVLLLWIPTRPGYLTKLILWGGEIAQRGPWPPGTWLHPTDGWWHVMQFVAHALLITLMLIASLIDFDEKLIPDEITVPGTYLGLLLAFAWPRTLPIGIASNLAGRVETAMLTVTSPNNWPDWLEGAPGVWSLALAVACFTVWYFALWPWLFRRGRSWRRAVALTFAVMRRHAHRWALWWLPGAMIALILIAWYQGNERWHALVSSLVGMVVGGVLVFVTRIVASHVLGREALGFGDVTLLAMIGSFLGWQATVLVFFIAPLFALVVALVQLVLRREGEIYYGPFLCLATLWVILRWPSWWDWAGLLFEIPWLVPMALVACLGLLWFLLQVVRAIKEALFRLFGVE